MEEVSEKQLHAVLQRDQAVMIYFYTPWCGTCKIAEKMILAAEELSAAPSAYKGNVNLMPEIVQQLKIQSVPCVKIFKEGDCKETIYAFGSIESFINNLKPYIK
ncbi:thioredoxin family protein [Thalassorhabdus alkalitolerans]|uniref:Thioredoxin family protein n=1 Tax=Thalassorhabdus alkalitolerans TaxID=2282697 RepID=A0ABW0YV93_9BACI|nr:thioredoxin family protein [Thalassobacillus sp. C254]